MVVRIVVVVVVAVEVVVVVVVAAVVDAVVAVVVVAAAAVPVVVLLLLAMLPRKCNECYYSLSTTVHVCRTLAIPKPVRMIPPPNRRGQLPRL